MADLTPEVPTTERERIRNLVYQFTQGFHRLDEMPDLILATLDAARAVPAGLDVERLREALQSAGIPWGAFGVACDGSCTVVDHYRRAAERIAREYDAAKENDHE